MSQHLKMDNYFNIPWRHQGLSPVEDVLADKNYLPILPTFSTIKVNVKYIEEKCKLYQLTDICKRVFGLRYSARSELISVKELSCIANNEEDYEEWSESRDLLENLFRIEDTLTIELDSLEINQHTALLLKTGSIIVDIFDGVDNIILSVGFHTATTQEIGEFCNRLEYTQQILSCVKERSYQIFMLKETLKDKMETVKEYLYEVKTSPIMTKEHFNQHYNFLLDYKKLILQMTTYGDMYPERFLNFDEIRSEISDKQKVDLRNKYFKHKELVEEDIVGIWHYYQNELDLF